MERERVTDNSVDEVRGSNLTEGRGTDYVERDRDSARDPGEERMMKLGEEAGAIEQGR